MDSCPFCSVPRGRRVGENESCLAVQDRFPVSSGHTLIIPRRHIASFREMNEKEWTDAHRLAVERAAALQRDDASIQGFNFGINDGRAAGQTIFHVHLHLIPRRVGDVREPEGGVRGVIPGKQKYAVGGDGDDAVRGPASTG